jgi:hypothetical protein
MREVRPRLGFDPRLPVGVFAALLVIGCLTATCCSGRAGSGATQTSVAQLQVSGGSPARR